VSEGNAVRQSDIPETTLYLIELRASQINDCSICVDMHSHELKLAGEPDHPHHAVAAWRGAPVRRTESGREGGSLTQARGRVRKGVQNSSQNVRGAVRARVREVSDTATNRI
jgi:AhpD family alkylhydroperoxidase